MKHTTRIAGVSALALLLAGTSAFAQTTLTGTQALEDRIEDIEDDIAEDMERAEDANRFGAAETREGLSGSASLGYSGSTGNEESQDLTAGARLRFAQGQFVQTIGLALEFTETDNQATKEDVFAVYDANYYFNDSFYGFALGRIASDGLADGFADRTKTDAFLGFGPGYRIVNTPDLAWRVQAGIGVSYLEDGFDNSETETGYIASSRLFWRINENVFATNDTDILKSDSALRINNDLGVNFKVTDAFATRVSYLTDYNDSNAIRTDNKLGVSLVYGF
ncbi:DUF481 domain-containing protein [Fertoebacter nigrum]|uniref:DUF481 domain-containing protein n=1 Tax=Fertoeibacter niger TaxID=2656921 RepID=A0A8X8H0K9_9RHOB|nr:DUF481 domain-containing protein [Fertoeibacter niger]NUB43922.1 DUF481 domain-containing protein [Fertoeibacter niger]